MTHKEKMIQGVKDELLRLTGAELKDFDLQKTYKIGDKFIYMGIEHIATSQPHNTKELKISLADYANAKTEGFE